MPRTGDDEELDSVERVANHADRLKSAWGRTLEDVQALAEERESNGWETLVIAAGDTAPEHPDVRDDDLYGLVFVIPDNFADEFAEKFEAGTFPKYEVYRQENDGFVFLVVEYLDPGTETAIYVAGSYELRFAAPMVNLAQENDGEIYTIVRRLDGTVEGTFRHADYEKFVPHADRIDDWVVTPDVGVPEKLNDVDPDTE